MRITRYKNDDVVVDLVDSLNVDLDRDGDMEVDVSPAKLVSHGIGPKRPQHRTRLTRITSPSPSRSTTTTTTTTTTMTTCLLLLLASALFAACATPPSARECDTGITCPDGTKCAAVQAVCITNDCGDGIVQGTEACDDGNIEDGDGCAANCQSRETCGDGVLNAAAGELCDDGNTTGGDGCAADCKSVEICGNGIRDVNEACDDGNTVPGDGCSGNCKSTEICGNNIVDLDEKCDDGGAAGGCNDDCQGGTGCGDGAIDKDGSGNALEECDDGNTDDHDDCTNGCKLNICGDGNIQSSGARTEECDPSAGFGETLDCNLDCTSSICGDNKINNAAGEQCDAGAALDADDRDCTSQCKLNYCGDSLPNTTGPNKKEDCDDGNSNNADSCPNTCKMPMCGNGLVEAMNNEACDDGNMMNGDGCSSACKFEKCGDGLINNGEPCDGTGTTTVVGTPGETSTCNTDCTSRSCGDGKVNKSAGEQCDDQNMNDSGDACRNNCKLNVCGDNSKSATEGCDDGNQVNTDGCTNGCTLPTCGNGVTDPGEECDDGNTDDNDGCLTTTCLFNTCGDGKLYTGVEECDNGIDNSVTNDCLPNCKLNVCGDGFIDLDGGTPATTEACDDGNKNTETACPYGISSCTQCSDDCNTVLNLSGNICGDGDPDPVNEDCDDNNNTTESACPYNSPGGACNICDSQCQTVAKTGGAFCGDGSTSNGEVCDDHNTLSCGTCSSACTFANTPTAATGVIIASDNSGGNISDGDTMTISDGVVTVKFEFDKNATQSDANAVLVDTNGSLTATQVRDKVELALAAAKTLKGLRITATDAGTTGIALTTNRTSSAGNVAILRTGLGSSFYISGMSGGAAGDCASGTACKSDNDCLAGLTGSVGNCVNSVCQ